MAHAAKIGALTDDLISTVTGLSSREDGRLFKQCKDSALKTFKFNQHVRVNQFDVEARLEGLQEKFVVLNNEPLADALKTRLDELAQRSSKWRPEVLALFLGLSDRPVEKTDIEEALEINVPEAVPQLTWADIIAEDPLTEEGIWDDVEIESDFSDHSAPSIGDDSDVEHTASTQASSVGEEDIAAYARTFLVSREEKVVDEIKELRGKMTSLRSSRRSDASEKDTINLTELQAVRQVLFMLHGLPSDLFTTSDPGQIQPRALCHVSSIAPSTVGRIMHCFVDLGNQLVASRSYAESPQSGVVLQRLQATIQKRLYTFGKALSSLEQRYLVPCSSDAVSLMGLQAEAEHLARPLILLAKLLPDKTSNLNASTMHVLDSLFEEACTLQLVGEVQDFCSVAQLFFDCLEIYLRRVRLWMAEGKLQESDELFFVRFNDEHVDRGSIWQSRFSVLRKPDGSACAPSFMQQMAERIFKAGKSVMFLEALGRGPEISSKASACQRIDGDGIIGSMTDSLLPFSGVFQDALNSWVDALESRGSQSLRHILMSQCELKITVDAIDNLLLGKNGAHVKLFAQGVFARMDRGHGWNDRFLLTELAHNAFGSLDCVDTDHLSVRIRASDSKDLLATTIRPSEALDRVLIDYSINWPLQNVLTEETLATCQRTFSMQLRLQRAQHVLNQYGWTLSIVSAHNRDHRVKQLLALRQRLIWFIGVFRSYTSEVLSLATRQLSTNLDNDKDVDAIVKTFTSFRHDLEGKLLLMTNLRPIRQALLALLDLCEDFGAAWKDVIKRISETTPRQTSRHLAVQQNREPRRGAPTEDDMADSGEDDDDDAEDEQELHAFAPAPASALDVPGLLAEYERQLSFALAGLRGVSRVEAEPAWIMLAERLEWGIRAGGGGGVRDPQ